MLISLLFHPKFYRKVFSHHPPPPPPNTHTLQNAGFDARVDTDGLGSSGMSHSKSIKKWRNTFIFSLVFAIPTVLIAFLPIEWLFIIPGLTVRDVLLFLLSTTIQVLYRVYVCDTLNILNDGFKYSKRHY